MTTAVALAAPLAGATHNNQGTIKVHDDEDVDPDQRNQPKVSCDFWIEGFKMGDDTGWIEFFSWPPTGDFEPVDPTGASLEWEADAGEASGEFHFLAGPYQLPSGHYRVEVYTDDGHPGQDGGHFAKAKMFWVDECEPETTVPPCPPGVEVTATTDPEEGPVNKLTWEAVEGADAYLVFRAVEGGEFELVLATEDTSMVDADVEAGLTYEYVVEAVVDGVSSQNCESVSVVAIPFFPTMLVGALALAGSLGAFVLLRRRSA